MSIFASPKQAAFAIAAFSAAGLDFNAAFAANDTEAIKKALAAGKTAGAPDLAAAEATLAAAAAENTALKTTHATALADVNGKLATATTSLATANAALAKQTALAGVALKHAGLTDATPEALATGLVEATDAAAIAKLAAEGHPSFDETPTAAGAGKKKQAAASTGLTGLAATTAALKARKAAAK